MEIRQATDGQRGLQHALRAMLGYGNIELESAIEPLHYIGDQATGTQVLASLYGRMKDSPYPVDLARLWDRLGVSVALGRGRVRRHLAVGLFQGGDDASSL